MIWRRRLFCRPYYVSYVTSQIDDVNNFAHFFFYDPNDPGRDGGAGQLAARVQEEALGDARVGSAAKGLYALPISSIAQLIFLFLSRKVRDEKLELEAKYARTEDDLKALQSVGQIIAEVLKMLDNDRCAPRSLLFNPLKRRKITQNTGIVKASSGPRYLVGCRAKLDKSKLVQNTRVSLDMTTLTIMRIVHPYLSLFIYVDEHKRT